MYKKSDILHNKYYMCLREHNYKTIRNLETKKGYRLISYLAFLNIEYNNFKKYKDTKDLKFKEQREVLYAIIDTMNIICNKYLNL